MSPRSRDDRLPFEPRGNRKKTPKATPAAVAPAKTEPSRETGLQAIPPAVSRRMARRMALFSGVPTALGVLSFFAFYRLVSEGVREIPPYVPMVVSSLLFGTGFFGLSYGIFSASWDEERVGSWLGWDDFQTNFGRTIAAWRPGK